MDIQQIDNILESIVKPIYKQYYDHVYTSDTSSDKTTAKSVFQNKSYVNNDTGELNTEQLGRLFTDIRTNPTRRVYVGPRNVEWYSNDKNSHNVNGQTVEILSYPVFIGNISGRRTSFDHISSDFGNVYRIVVQRFMYVKEMFSTNQYRSSSSYDNSEYLIDIDRVSQDIYAGYTGTSANSTIIPFNIYIEAMYIYYFLYLMYLNAFIVKILDDRYQKNSDLINDYRDTIAKTSVLYSNKLSETMIAIKEYENTVSELNEINSDMSGNKSLIDIKIKTLNNITDADKSKDWVIYLTVVIAIVIMFGLIYVSMLKPEKQLLFSVVLVIILMSYYIAMYFYFDYAIADIEGFRPYFPADDIKFQKMMDVMLSYIKKKQGIHLIEHVFHNGLKSETELYQKLNDTLSLNIKKVDSSLNDAYINLHSKKELMNLIIYLTLLIIIIYIINKHIDMREITFGISIVMLTFIFGIYLYNVNINERRNYLKKYWNHKYSYKANN